MTTVNRQELFSAHTYAGSRTYFFDVKCAADGTRYMTLSETRQVGEEREHHRVMIFEEHLQAFLEGLSEATEFLRVSGKAYSIEEIRRQHPRAYEQWTKEEDNRLRARFEQGFGMPELAHEFNRKESAIRSRLLKLGLGPQFLPPKG
jgi:hypothetical protein